MPWISQRSGPTPVERIIAGICYLTFGLVGLLYVILNGKQAQAPFFRFHFLQSIILGIIALIASWAMQFLMMVINGLINLLSSIQPALGMQVYGGINITLAIVSKAALLLLVYGFIWALAGKYAEIPFVSNIVRQQIR